MLFLPSSLFPMSLPKSRWFSPVENSCPSFHLQFASHDAPFPVFRSPSIVPAKTQTQVQLRSALHDRPDAHQASLQQAPQAYRPTPEPAMNPIASLTYNRRSTSVACSANSDSSDELGPIIAVGLMALDELERLAIWKVLIRGRNWEKNWWKGGWFLAIEI